jgi:hypothetical protein
MNTELVNIIFGMKVRQARLEADLTLSEFAQRCESIRLVHHRDRKRAQIPQTRQDTQNGRGSQQELR